MRMSKADCCCFFLRARDFPLVIPITVGWELAVRRGGGLFVARGQGDGGTDVVVGTGGSHAKDGRLAGETCSNEHMWRELGVGMAPADFFLLEFEMASACTRRRSQVETEKDTAYSRNSLSFNTTYHIRKQHYFWRDISWIRHS